MGGNLTGACTIKTLRICNLQIPQQANVFVEISIFFTDNIKDTSSLQNLSVFHKLRKFYSTGPGTPK